MEFTGVSGADYFSKLETAEGINRCIVDTYRTLVSLVRASNISRARGVSALFPDEYNEESTISDSSIKDGALLFANRETAEFNMWPKNSRILEIGVASGRHSQSIITNLYPKLLHGVDINLSQLSDDCKQFFQQANQSMDLCFWECSSHDFLKQQIESKIRYDVIYIDSSHWHAVVAQEIALACTLLSKGGRMVLNDYQNWFVDAMEPCGVIKAVNEFLGLNCEWKVEYFALNDCDISLIKYK